MVSNETILMCGETSVTNAPLCIRHSTQISQSIRWSILKKGKYLLLEITWDDYVLNYILKYIPTYVRVDWPSTTTRPTHTKGPKFFTKLFVDITHTHTSNILGLGGTRSPRGRVSFSGYLHANAMRISKTTNCAKNVPLWSKIYYKHMIIYNYKHEYTFW